jgi:hypothetical protein
MARITRKDERRSRGDSVAVAHAHAGDKEDCAMLLAAAKPANCSAGPACATQTRSAERTFAYAAPVAAQIHMRRSDTERLHDQKDFRRFFERSLQLRAAARKKPDKKRVFDYALRDAEMLQFCSELSDHHAAGIGFP